MIIGEIKTVEFYNEIRFEPSTCSVYLFVNEVRMYQFPLIKSAADRNNLIKRCPSEINLISTWSRRVRSRFLYWASECEILAMEVQSWHAAWLSDGIQWKVTAQLIVSMRSTSGHFKLDINDALFGLSYDLCGLFVCPLYAVTRICKILAESDQNKALPNALTKRVHIKSDRSLGITFQLGSFKRRTSKWYLSEGPITVALCARTQRVRLDCIRLDSMSSDLNHTF